jgi:hypothetical protein
MSVVNIEEDDPWIFVEMPFDEDAKEALKEQFGAQWDPDGRYWRINGYQHDVREVERELKLHFPGAFR